MAALPLIERIAVGAIEQCDAEVERAADERDGLMLGRAMGEREPHTTEADGAHSFSGLPEFALPHQWPL
jgi:hypothetical protein